MAAKVAVIGIAAVLVIAMIVAAVVVVHQKKSDEEEQQVQTSSKAAEALCAQTDYKDTCHKSLSKSNSSDPKQLVQAALEYSVETISGAIKESDGYKKAAADKDTKDALSVCEDVLNKAVDDLKRAFDKVGDYDGTSSGVIEDLKTWLSATGTYQQTCIDAFDKTSSETGEKMKKDLETSKQLSSNGLAMLDGISSILHSLGIDFKNGRKLLTAEEEARLLYDFDSPTAGAAAINSVVAQDGSGQFRTINEAVKMIPPSNNNTYVIFVKAGVYAEQVIIPRYTNKVVLLGEGPQKSRITGAKNVVDGDKVYYTATVAVNGDDFVAKDIAFENTAGAAKGQAVALRISGDRAVLSNCNMDGFGGTLYTHTYRQFYRGCTISGTVDFVFGDALAIFQACTFVVRKPMVNQACTVAAQSRMDPRSLGAIVIQGGKISAAPDFLAPPPAKAFLGRPGKEMSRTIIMQAEIDGFIAPEGWAPPEVGVMDNCYFAEFQNKGPGSDMAKRVVSKAIQRIDLPTAEAWTPAKAFIGDVWITNAAIPGYEPGMLKV